jgi:uncharacterized protein (DUF169 family)
LAESIRALGDATRLQILTLLLSGEHTAVECEEHLGLAAGSAEEHLGKLVAGGYLLPRHEGGRTRYRVIDQRAADLVRLARSLAVVQLTGLATCSCVNHETSTDREVSMKPAELARTLTEHLGLPSAPIALRFVDSPPPGTPQPDRAAPSACSFWPAAEHGTFYASAAQHMHCPVGAMVLGFELPEPVQQRLGELVTEMTACGYLVGDEPAAIPTVSRHHAGIVYGPLAESPAAPDLVLFWADARQAMMTNEAIGAADWTAGLPTVTGRPGCAALALATKNGKPTFSLGCAGMRTFTQVADDRILVAIPGGQIELFVSELVRLTAANNHMSGLYEQQRAQFSTA